MVESSSESDSDSEVASSDAAPDWLTAEDCLARNVVFLVTFAAILEAPDAQGQYPAHVPPRSLEGVTREQIRDAVLDAVAHPAAALHSAGGRPRTKVLSVVKLVVFLEQPLHFHVALRLSAESRFLPLKDALRQRSGFASHWSSTHTLFWSAVRYGVMATTRKPEVDGAPLVFTQSGQPLNLFEESQEPWNANAQKRRREAAAVVAAASAVAKKVRFNKMDFTAVVIDKGIRTPAGFLSHVQQQGTVEMQMFASRSQRRLREYIDDAWEWNNAQSVASQEMQSDWSLLAALASRRCACIGPCAWAAASQAFFANNADSIDERELAACTAKVIREGPSKTTRVPLLAGPTNSGKSTVFDPVDEVFGPSHVFHTPALGASMALSNLATKTKRFIYFDDYRPVEFAAVPAKPAATVPVVTFLKLFGGQHLEVAVSQSFNNGHIDFRWTRGVVMTAKSEGLWDRQGVVTHEDVRHMQSRVRQFTVVHQLAQHVIRPASRCSSSFARWLLTASQDAAAGIPIELPVHHMSEEATLNSESDAEVTYI